VFSGQIVRCQCVGDVAVPQLTMNPTSLDFDFGIVRLKQPSRHVITLSNCGHSPVVYRILLEKCAVPAKGSLGTGVEAGGDYAHECPHFADAETYDSHIRDGQFNEEAVWQSVSSPEAPQRLGVFTTKRWWGILEKNGETTVEFQVEPTVIGDRYETMVVLSFEMPESEALLSRLKTCLVSRPGNAEMERFQQTLRELLVDHFNSHAIIVGKMVCVGGGAQPTLSLAMIPL